MKKLIAFFVVAICFTTNAFCGIGGKDDRYYADGDTGLWQQEPYKNFVKLYQTYRVERGMRSVGICTAEYIAPNLILSAGHCTEKGWDKIEGHGYSAVNYKSSDWFDLELIYNADYTTFSAVGDWAVFRVKDPKYYSDTWFNVSDPTNEGEQKKYIEVLNAGYGWARIIKDEEIETIRKFISEQMQNSKSDSKNVQSILTDLRRAQSSSGEKFIEFKDATGTSYKIEPLEEDDDRLKASNCRVVFTPCTGDNFQDVCLGKRHLYRDPSSTVRGEASYPNVIGTTCDTWGGNSGGGFVRSGVLYGVNSFGVVDSLASFDEKENYSFMASAHQFEDKINQLIVDNPPDNAPCEKDYDDYKGGQVKGTGTIKSGKCVLTSCSSGDYSVNEDGSECVLSEQGLRNKNEYERKKQEEAAKLRQQQTEQEYQAKINRLLNIIQSTSVSVGATMTLDEYVASSKVDKQLTIWIKQCKDLKLKNENIRSTTVDISSYTYKCIVNKCISDDYEVNADKTKCVMTEAARNRQTTPVPVTTAETPAEKDKKFEKQKNKIEESTRGLKYGDTIVFSVDLEARLSDVIRAWEEKCKTELSGSVVDKKGTFKSQKGLKCEVKCDAQKGEKPNKDRTKCITETENEDVVTDSGAGVIDEIIEDKTKKKNSIGNKVITKKDLADDNTILQLVNSIVEYQVVSKELEELQKAYDEAKAKEQSLANRALTALTVAAMGIGGMELAQGLAEQKADKDADQNMRAYIATMKCTYANGKTVKASPAEVELPGGNDQQLMNYRAEYLSLASDLKERKNALGMKAGIESEEILDKVASGLYDDENVGIESGAYESRYRALMLGSEQDQAMLDEAAEKSSKRVKGGAIAAGAGAVVGIGGNALINGKLGEKIGLLKGKNSSTKENNELIRKFKDGLSSAGMKNVEGLDLSGFDFTNAKGLINNTDFSNLDVSGQDATKLIDTSNIDSFKSSLGGLKVK